MSECLKPGHPDPLCPHHSHAQNPTRRRVWSKKSRNRKYCRERAKFTLKYKKRRPIGIEDPRKVCPYHDKKQHRRCIRLPTCPASYVSRPRTGQPKSSRQKQGVPRAPTPRQDAHGQRVRPSNAAYAARALPSRR